MIFCSARGSEAFCNGKSASVGPGHVVYSFFSKCHFGTPKSLIPNLKLNTNPNPNHYTIPNPNAIPDPKMELREKKIDDIHLPFQ